MAPEARIRLFLRNGATALCAGAVALLSFSLGAEAARRHYRSHQHHVPEVAAVPPRALPYPQLALPFEIPGAQYLPLVWADVRGWSDDDHLAAYKTFRASCRSINALTGTPEPKALGASLSEPCRAAKTLDLTDDAKAKSFFEENFSPLRISRLGEPDGFVTGYYEPVLDGSRTQTEVYNVPIYRRPSNLFVRGYKQDTVSLPNKGPVYRKIGRRKLVPYYDRGEIEDGKIAGRGLEIAWLKDPTDLLFAQIQGSARIKLDDDTTVRLNYDAYNGFPYTAVGRILIERGIIPKEEMSMQKIREWMAQNPDGAKELRRQNRSYIFFREVNLSRQIAPRLWHAVLHRGRAADRFRALQDAIPPPDDRAGHRLRHYRTCPRGSLFWRRPGRRPRLGPAAPSHALRDAGAEEPRSRRPRREVAGAGSAAVGEDRKAVSANRSR